MLTTTGNGRNGVVPFCVLLVGMYATLADAQFSVTFSRRPIKGPPYTFSADVSYSASVQSMIVVEVLSTGTFQWYGNGVVEVSSGSGCKTVFVAVANSPSYGSNYILKTFIVTKADYAKYGAGNAWQYATSEATAAFEFANVLDYGGASQDACEVVGNGGFDPCKFNFGMGFDGGAGSKNFTNIDYISLWAGSYDTSGKYGNNFNPYHHGSMLATCMATGATPAYYAYFIAYLARQHRQLKDCDVGTPNLCQYGADFIREEEALILAHYRNYSIETANRIGTNAKILWLLEPDFYQYNESHQNNGGVSGADLAILLGKFITIIKTYLPNAIISFDISPWTHNITEWLAFYQNLPIDLMNTSSGRTEPASDRIRLWQHNDVTWKIVHQLTGRKLLADTGYGVAGDSMGHVDKWDNVTSLNARIQDGLIGIMQRNAKDGWQDTIRDIRPQLIPIPGCGGGFVSATGASGGGVSATGVSSSSSVTSTGGVAPSSTSSSPSSTGSISASASSSGGNGGFLTSASVSSSGTGAGTSIGTGLPPPAPVSSSNAGQTGGIIGGVTVGVLLALVAVVIVIRRRRRQRGQHEKAVDKITGPSDRSFSLSDMRPGAVAARAAEQARMSSTTRVEPVYSTRAEPGRRAIGGGAGAVIQGYAATRSALRPERPEGGPELPPRVPPRLPPRPVDPSASDDPSSSHMDLPSLDAEGPDPPVHHPGSVPEHQAASSGHFNRSHSAASELDLPCLDDDEPSLSQVQHHPQGDAPMLPPRPQAQAAPRHDQSSAGSLAPLKVHAVYAYDPDSGAVLARGQSISQLDKSSVGLVMDQPALSDPDEEDDASIDENTFDPQEAYPEFAESAVTDYDGEPSAALAADLPPGWGAYEDDEGNPYYFNENTGESRWEPPTEEN